MYVRPSTNSLTLTLSQTNNTAVYIRFRNLCVQACVLMFVIWWNQLILLQRKRTKSDYSKYLIEKWVRFETKDFVTTLLLLIPLRRITTHRTKWHDMCAITSTSDHDMNTHTHTTFIPLHIHVCTNLYMNTLNDLPTLSHSNQQHALK